MVEENEDTLILWAKHKGYSSAFAEGGNAAQWGRMPSPASGSEWRKEASGGLPNPPVQVHEAVDLQ